MGKLSDFFRWGKQRRDAVRAWNDGRIQDLGVDSEIAAHVAHVARRSGGGPEPSKSQLQQTRELERLLDDIGSFCKNEISRNSTEANRKKTRSGFILQAPKNKRTTFIIGITCPRGYDAGEVAAFLVSRGHNAKRRSGIVEVTMQWGTW